jgi:demethylmenaquinone methyltransferase/2-methoxy-6-polyprenyl-1,4-benzoquinol methylase
LKTVRPHPPLTQYYGDPSQREGFVRDIFDETAPWYDWAIRLLSFGSGDWYRREAVKRLGYTAGMRLLDVASGTGVVARAAAAVTGTTANIFEMDPSIGMLRAAQSRSAKIEGAAEALPVASESVDRITIGFALRHFADLGLVFSECRRVLRPGGKLMILEITAPEAKAARAILGVYMGRIAPAIIRMRANARTAELFRYYWETTRDCVRPEVILDAMRDAGFSNASRSVELGIFSEYVGERS